ncbi:MAG: tetratricopeptide repeat protein [Bdellovibrionales bacterium]|nr:tetratricopeptide repeat protein [Bdellovibrionales bacterium]
MTRIGPFAITIAVAFGLWFGATSLSDFLSNQYRRRENHANPTELPEAVAALEKQLESDGSNLQLHMKAAQMLYEEARSSRNSALIMKAVEHYAFILRREPNNRDALGELAALCFEQGILDKAEEYLRRLISIEPDNIRARTDLALVLVQSGKAEESIGLLNAVIKDNPALFPPRFALALAYRVLGEREKAKQAAQDSLAYAPDETARQRIARFVEGIDETPPPTLEAFIRSHSILGPKVTSIEDNGQGLLTVKLREFPIENMPPVARNVFTSKLQQALIFDKQINKCILLDSESGKQLIEIAEE